MASRGAEAFVRSRMAELMTARREAVEPPLYDLPFDLTTAPTEQPVPAAMPTPENPVLPELPPAAPEGVTASAETPVLAEPSAPLELPAPATPEPSVEPVEKSARRRHHSEPETLPAEKNEDAWTPAYRDTPTEQRHGATSKKTANRTPETTPQEPGEPYRVKTRDASPARKAERAEKTPTGRDAAPVEERRSVKEKGGASNAQQSPAMEPGRQKFIRERGLEATARQTEARIPENRNAYAHTEARPAVVEEHSVPQLREQPPVRTREAGPRLKDTLPDHVGGSSDRVVVRIRDAKVITQNVSPVQYPGQQSAGTAEQGKRELIRERSQQPAVKQAETAASVHDYPSAKGDIPADTSAPNPQKTPDTRRVAAQTAEASGYYPAPSDASMTPQNAVSGRQAAVRERTNRVAEKPVSIGRDSPHQSRSNPSFNGGGSPVDTVQQNRIPVKTGEAAGPDKPLPSTRETSQVSTQGRQKAIRERAEKIAEKPVPADRTAAKDGPQAVRERVESVREKPPSVPVNSGKEPSKAAHEDRIPVKTRKAYVQRETPAETAETSRNAGQGKQKAIRERTERMTGGTVKTTPKGDKLHPQVKPAPDNLVVQTHRLVPKQEQVPVKTRETYALRQTPPATGEIPVPTNQGRTAFVRERAESGQVSIKTKDVYLQSQSPVIETSTPRMDEAIPKEAPKELRKTVRTRQGFIQQPEPSAESVAHQTNTLDGKHPAKAQAVRTAEASTPQTEAVSPLEAPAQETSLSTGKDQRIPDIKNRSAYAQKEAALPCEQPDHTVEQGRQKFMREQKRKADMKRTAERRPKIQEAQLPGEEAEAASDEAKNLAMDRMRQTQTVRTKEAWLRQQGLDGPKERAVPELRGGRTSVRQTAGNLPTKSADGLHPRQEKHKRREPTAHTSGRGIPKQRYKSQNPAHTVHP